MIKSGDKVRCVRGGEWPLTDGKEYTAQPGTDPDYVKVVSDLGVIGGFDHSRFVMANPTGPVVEETVKRIVPGVYGVLEVGKSLEMPVQCGTDEKQPVVYVSIVSAYSTAPELRAAAAVLLELAGALE